MQGIQPISTNNDFCMTQILPILSAETFWQKSSMRKNKCKKICAVSQTK